MATIYVSLTIAYAKAVYLDGTKRLSDVRPEYVEPVKQYAATNYSKVQLENALAKGYISQAEYDDTLIYA